MGHQASVLQDADQALTYELSHGWWREHSLKPLLNLWLLLAQSNAGIVERMNSFWQREAVNANQLQTLLLRLQQKVGLKVNE